MFCGGSGLCVHNSDSTKLEDRRLAGQLLSPMIPGVDAPSPIMPPSSRLHCTQHDLSIHWRHWVSLWSVFTALRTHTSSFIPHSCVLTSSNDACKRRCFFTERKLERKCSCIKQNHEGSRKTITFIKQSINQSINQSIRP